MKPRVFLTAGWRNLINLTYSVDPALLEPHVPKGTELDIQNGRAFVSFVAFDFINTRVKGIKIPFHVNFPEINLRFYLKYKNRRAVAFIREYVPRFCISFVANRLYNEPYATAPMRSHHSFSPEGQLNQQYFITIGGTEYSISGKGSKETHIAAEDSPEHYFKEHDLGFGVDHKGRTLFYLVEHPVWETRQLLSYELNADFGKMYSRKWAFLSEEKPLHTVFAVGSAVKVYHPAELERFDEVMG